ncbi:flagellar hook-length control protein FliK [Vibrio campbellii]|uniref:flagellar hook-length control protein FliK n=1 Tax=Vibrio campbellii TaxID=680 RepID=UPI00026C5513|nr:flagellar hook-length control protein FliK [Vibrio campbellii]AXB33822.1 flagellar hook-length control protein FliK [Vibrio campbellii]UTZ43923.1 flagellar hook-length control protein FliK [Vibrio campbellii]
MMVTNSVSANAPSQSSSSGKISQARSEQGFSQTDAASVNQQGQTNAPLVVAGFRLNAQALPTQATQPQLEVSKVNLGEISQGTFLDLSNLRIEVQISPTEPTPPEADTPELNSEVSSNEALLSAVTTTTDLATQAQALIQGMSKTALKQGKANQLAQVSAGQASQNTNVGNQANPVLNTTVQESQHAPQTSATSALKVSASDLQTLLNQPVQGQVLAASSQAQTTGAAPHSNPTSPLAATQAQGAEWAAVRVDTSSGKWGEQMMQVLQDRVTLQAQQNLQEAKIRLDPPELGKLDLLVRVEGDRLSVQINANTAATREALMQVSERLRNELQEQNFVHVDVNVGSDQGQERQAHDGAPEEANIFAARETNAFQTHTTTSYSEHWLNTQA